VSTAVVDPEIRVYWKPGCSNCVRLKEYVTRRGFEFTAVNVAADPTGFVVLESLGVKGLPVLTRGDRYVFGLDLAMVDEILGIDSDRDSLPVEELVGRAVKIVSAAIRLGRQLPEARYDDPLPGRPQRTYFMLINHVVGHLSRLVQVGEQPETDFSPVDVYALAGYQSPIGEDYMDESMTVDDIEKRATDLQRRAEAWLASGDDFSRPVEMFYGTVPLYQVIESNTYSVAQHTRQLQAVITFLGYQPNGPIGEAEYRGLNLPVALWDEV
jgi:glutaredoxin